MPFERRQKDTFFGEYIAPDDPEPVIYFAGAIAFIVALVATAFIGGLGLI